MANKKITELPSISAPLKGSDLWEVSIDDGSSFSSHQTTGDELKALLSLGGDQYTFVKADGTTPLENGKQLNNGFNTAIAKLINTETPQTLILAPGTYMLINDYTIPDGLSIVSLTGERDVLIDMDGHVVYIGNGNTKLRGLNFTNYGNIYYYDYGTYGSIIDNCNINALIAVAQNIPFYGTIINSSLSGIYAPFSGTMKDSNSSIFYTDADTGYGLYLYPYLDGVNTDGFYCDDNYDITFGPKILNCSGRFFDQTSQNTLIEDGTFKNITNFSMSYCRVFGSTLFENCIGYQRVLENISFYHVVGYVDLKVINCHQKDNDGGFFIRHNKQTYSSINIEFRDCTAYGNAFIFKYADTEFNDYNVLVDNCKIIQESSVSCFNHIIETNAIININDVTFKDCKAGNSSDCFNANTNNTGDLYVYNFNFINCVAGDNSFFYFDGIGIFNAKIDNFTFLDCVAGYNSFISLVGTGDIRANQGSIKNCTAGPNSFISSFATSGSSTINNTKPLIIDNCTAGDNSFFYIDVTGDSNIYLNTVENKITNCTAENNSFVCVNDPFGIGSHQMEIRGTFYNCKALDRSFGSINPTFASCYILHDGGATYTHCKAGSASFMGNIFAKLTSCTAGADSFGTVWMNTNMNGGANGTFENCYGLDYSFAGSSNIYTNFPFAFGQFKYCYGSYGCFGSYYDNGGSDATTAIGTFLWCEGSQPFGTMFGSPLQGGGRLYWSRINGYPDVVWNDEKYNVQ